MIKLHIYTTYIHISTKFHVQKGFGFSGCIYSLLRMKNKECSHSWRETESVPMREPPIFIACEKRPMRNASLEATYIHCNARNVNCLHQLPPQHQHQQQLLYYYICTLAQCLVSSHECHWSGPELQWDL